MAETTAATETAATTTTATETAAPAAAPTIPASLLGAPPAAETATTEKPAGEVQTEEAAKPTGAPEKYEFKAPEGMTLNQQEVEAFTPLAKEFNLTQEQAQKGIDLLAKIRQGDAQANQAAYTKQVETWQSAVMADKEIGGTALESNLAKGNAFLGKFATPELSKALVETGMGNHPEFVRLIVRLANASAEDTHANGADTVPKRSAAEVLYGSK